ncbi:hypothetical protein NONO_c41890 [Nocardia nova SH22a]|uniref:Uncharacterized protein n=1 Tax=Nocardia nova SH22a TaxID=1415166 RepID=W5TJ43_9NOCA|nr:hypothetical protein [Nocardia nova]AHH18973.1 hypothetical protein NONO_c41890 [Nocardia nova SH22a]
MTRIAITGHRGLPERTTALVDAQLRAELADRSDDRLVGISCIADGADSLFARAVLDCGGDLVVVVPAREYRAGLPAEHHPVYDDLLSEAAEVIRLEHVESNSEAHQAGSVRMLDEADELFAVWDGKPARGYGGTTDVVAVARERGLPVTVVWPEGSARD